MSKRDEKKEGMAVYVDRGRGKRWKQGRKAGKKTQNHEEVGLEQTRERRIRGAKRKEGGYGRVKGWRVEGERRERRATKNREPQEKGWLG